MRNTAQPASRLRISPAFAVLAVAAGVFPAFWGGIENGDTVRYLNMGRALASGHWMGVINGLWSPLYPALHGLGLFVFRPSWKQQIPVANLTNFSIYIFSVACFHFFWGQALALYRKHGAGWNLGRSPAILPANYSGQWDMPYSSILIFR